MGRPETERYGKRKGQATHRIQQLIPVVIEVRCHRQ